MSVLSQSRWRHRRDHRVRGDELTPGYDFEADPDRFKLTKPKLPKPTPTPSHAGAIAGLLVVGLGLAALGGKRKR